jgi:hypothetical protein
MYFKDSSLMIFITLFHIFFTIVSLGIFSNKFFSSSFNIKSKSLAVNHLDSPMSFLIKFTDAKAIFVDDKKSLKKTYYCKFSQLF